MANSRLEKIGTIFSRTKGLIQTGALKWQDRPIWYDVYEAFPPKEEPRFDRPTPCIPIRSIFYEEDKIRAKFHKLNKNIGSVNLSNNRTKSLTQHFIDTYQKLENQYAGSASEEQIYKEAVDMLKKEQGLRREAVDEEPISLTSAFKEAQRVKDKDGSANININVKDLFKE